MERRLAAVMIADVAGYCGPVFRNPGGTRALENEYLWDIGSAYTFSQVE
jgi:hypothetical protein